MKKNLPYAMLRMLMNRNLDLEKIMSLTFFEYKKVMNVKNKNVKALKVLENILNELQNNLNQNQMPVRVG